MVKMVGLLRKKAGMTTAEFRAYYEGHHAPLASRLMPPGTDYRRSYPNVVRIEGREAEGEPEFDAVSEVWFADRAAYETFAKAMQDPVNRAEIVEDEKLFMDRAATQIMVVEEHRSPAP